MSDGAPAGIVLVHGGFHDGTAWEATRAELASRGYDSAAPTLAGHGPGASADVTHADQVDSVVEAIDSFGGEPVVLVGHSYGGCVIQRVAQLVPARLSHLIFWAAVVVEPGESAADILPPGFLGDLPAGAVQVPVPPFEQAVSVFFNDMDPESARRAYEKLSPNPIAPGGEVLDTGSFFELEVPISVIVGTEDRSMPPGWEYHPHHSSKLGDFELFELPGGHELLFSDPAGLAAMILRSAGLPEKSASRMTP